MSVSQTQSQSQSQYVPPHLRSTRLVVAGPKPNAFRSNPFSLLATEPVAPALEAFPELVRGPVVSDVPACKKASAVISFADCLQGRKATKVEVHDPQTARDRVAPGWIRLKPWKVGSVRRNTYLEREAVMAPIRLGRALFRKRVLQQVEAIETQNALLGDLSPVWGQTYEDVYAVYEQYMQDEDAEDDTEVLDVRAGLESAAAEPALETV